MVFLEITNVPLGTVLAETVTYIIIFNCDYVELNHKMKHTIFLPSAFSTQC